jgi:hypothetical protein
MAKASRRKIPAVNIEPVTFTRFFVVGVVVLGFTVFCQLLVFCGPTLADFKKLGVSLLVGATALAVGCVAGILFSPVDRDERSRITVLTIAIGGLISGYALGKIVEPVIVELFAGPNARIFNEIEILANVFVAITTFHVGALGAYVYRTYYWVNPKDNTESQDKKPPNQQKRSAPRR